uniref:Uncharacterized protein n=1 Tax=Anguilla anguilla TaxID=7936 RepID=A0A0E9S8U5_ANGAN
MNPAEDNYATEVPVLQNLVAALTSQDVSMQRHEDILARQEAAVSRHDQVFGV